MKYLWTTLMVKDLDAAIKFYEEIVELKMTRRFSPSPDMEIAFVGEGETQLELMVNSKRELTHRSDISLGFKVESLDKIMERVLSKGFEPIGEIHQPNPHLKYFFVKDPNGFTVQFCEQTPEA